MKRHLLGSLPLAVLLSHCVGPYPGEGPFGPGTPRPYSNQHEHYRSETREFDRGRTGDAYDRGLRDGRMDFNSGEQKSYLRHSQNYDAGTRGPYIDGYDKGYGAGGSQPGAFAPQPERDPAYNQGYDYGLRDRVAGRPADVDAYIGRYDPRFRASFESGYHDAYESGRR